jgi:hypothetical protein
MVAPPAGLELAVPRFRGKARTCRVKPMSNRNQFSGNVVRRRGPHRRPKNREDEVEVCRKTRDDS